MLDKLASGAKIGQDLARVGSGVARGANRAKLMQGAAWTDTWPAPGSTLDLDFANDRGWVRGFGQGGVMDALTYTRASSATFVGPDGLLKTARYGSDPTGYVFTNGIAVAEQNLIPYSEDFSQATWTKEGVSVTLETDITPPAGVSSVYRITEVTGPITFSSLRSSGWLGNLINNTFSLHVKQDITSAKRYIFIGLVSGGLTRWAWAVFDIETQEITTFSDGIQNSVSGIGIAPLDDGWYRIHINFNSPLDGQQVSIGLSNTRTMTNSYNLGGYTGDGVSGMYIAGAQNERSGQIRFQPRFDWGSTVQEPQRNLLSFTDDFNDRSGTDGFGTFRLGSGLIASPTASETISTIHGNLQFFALTETTATSEHVFNIGRNGFGGLSPWPAPPETPVTFSWIIKRGSRRFIDLRQYSSTPFRRARFDLDEPGEILFSSSSLSQGFLSASIEDLGESVFRLSVVTPDQIGGGINSFRLFTCDDFGNTLYTGDGSIAVFTAAVQLELGDIATEYQSIAHPTTSTPLSATPTVNGILIEETRTNNLLWCRDLTQSYTPTNKNWFQHSNAFTNTIWNFDSNQAQISRTTGFADPFGGSDATRIQPNSGRTAANAYFGQRARTLYPATFSVYMKAAEYAYGVLSLFSYAAGNFAVFDLSTGTIFTAPTVAGLTADIESVGDGWYRCSLTVAVPERQRGFWISTSPDGATNTAANGTSGILIYGAQAENGLTATTYEDVANLPVALWTHDNVTVAKDQTGIDGVADAASSVTATADNAEIKQISLLAADVHTSSVFLKRITGSGVVQVSLDGVTYSTVDLSLTEWRRIALSGTVANPALGIRLATSGDVIAVDYGQIESGGFVTSPILTTSFIITRAADFITQRGGRVADWLILNSEGIFAIDFTITAIFPTSTDSFVAGLGITTNNNLLFEIVKYRHNGTALIPSNLNVFSGARNTVARVYLPRNGQQKSESAYTNTLISTVPVTTSGDNPWNIFGIGNSGRVFSAGTSGAMTVKRIFYIPSKSNGTILKELENNIL